MLGFRSVEYWLPIVTAILAAITFALFFFQTQIQGPVKIGAGVATMAWGFYVIFHYSRLVSALAAIGQTTGNTPFSAIPDWGLQMQLGLGPLFIVAGGIVIFIAGILRKLDK